MEFKNWLCIEEVFSLFRQICESRSVFEDIPIEGIKNEFNNLCGFQYEWHKYLLVLLNRKMPNASIQKKNTMLSDLFSTILTQKKELIKEFIDDIEKLKSPENPFGSYPGVGRVFESDEERKNAIRNFVGMVANRLISSMIRESFGGLRISEKIKQFNKKVENGEPFTGFADNEGAKQYWIHHFRATNPTTEEFVNFLKDFGNPLGDQMASRQNLKIAAGGLGADESDPNDLRPGKSVSGGDTKELEDHIISILQKRIDELKSKSPEQASAFDASKIKHLENAIKIVPLIKNHTYTPTEEGGGQHGLKQAVGREAGITNPNDIQQAFRHIQEILTQKGFGLGSERRTNPISSVVDSSF